MARDMLKPIRAALRIVLTIGLAQSMAPALAQADASSCSGADQSRIRAALNWLKVHLTDVDAKLGKNGLMNWPANEREAFRAKLNSPLQFICVDPTAIADATAAGEATLRCAPDYDNPLLSRIRPIIGQKRITLCMVNLREYAQRWSIPPQAALIHLIASSISQTLRVEEKRSDCAASYSSPIFSEALGFAAQSAYRGVDYDDERYRRDCPQRSRDNNRPYTFPRCVEVSTGVAKSASNWRASVAACGEGVAQEQALGELAAQRDRDCAQLSCADVCAPAAVQGGYCFGTAPVWANTAVEKKASVCDGPGWRASVSVAAKCACACAR